MALIKCPECGKDISNKADACIHCGYPLSIDDKFGPEITEYHEKCPQCGENHWVILGIAGEAICNYCNHKIILDQERYNYFEEKMAQKEREQKAEANKPKCPRCGCTDIQVLRKNHSLFGGFGTNAVERVCTKCKKRW